MKHMVLAFQCFYRTTVVCPYMHSESYRKIVEKIKISFKRPVFGFASTTYLYFLSDNTRIVYFDTRYQMDGFLTASVTAQFTVYRHRLYYNDKWLTQLQSERRSHSKRNILVTMDSTMRNQQFSISVNGDQSRVFNACVKKKASTQYTYRIFL